MSTFKSNIIKDLQELSKLGVGAPHIITKVKNGVYDEVIKDFENGSASVTETSDFILEGFAKWVSYLTNYLK